MKRGYLYRSPRPFPFAALTGPLGSGEDRFISARAQHEGSGSFDTRADGIPQGGLA